MNKELFPPLVSDGEPTREWNEPPLEEDFALVLRDEGKPIFRLKVSGPRWLTRRKFSKWSPYASSRPYFDIHFRIFRTKNVTFTRYSVTSRVLRRSFSKVSARVKTLAKRASFYASNLAPSSVETTTVRATSRRSRSDKDDDDHHFDDDQNLFLTCEWFYDASLTSPTLGDALERRRRHLTTTPSSKTFFTSSVELDGPIIPSRQGRSSLAEKVFQHSSRQSYDVVYYDVV